MVQQQINVSSENCLNRQDARMMVSSESKKRLREPWLIRHLINETLKIDSFLDLYCCSSEKIALPLANN